MKGRQRRPKDYARIAKEAIGFAEKAAASGNNAMRTRIPGACARGGVRKSDDTELVKQATSCLLAGSSAVTTIITNLIAMLHTRVVSHFLVL